MRLSGAMATPLVGRRVVVAGTSRQELNGCVGKAVDFDADKGRYNVQLDSGQVIALKPANLQEARGGTTSSTTKNGKSTPTEAGGGGIPWPTIGMAVLGAAWLYQFLQGSGGSSGADYLWGSDDVEYDDRDEAYMSGQVREIATLDQYRGALSHHSDGTGLPVVVDFFSHSCGPCRMIAPSFKRLAKEFTGRAAFLKVDVNRNYETSSACHIRGMPTFQFYLNKKKMSEFSGADERALRHYTDSIVQRAEDAGTFVGRVVTSESLRQFYTKHDASKVAEAESLAEKYSLKTALLMRVSRQKYGAVPETSPREAIGNKTTSKINGNGVTRNAGASAQPNSIQLAERSLQDLQAEVKVLQDELNRRADPQGAAAENEAEEEIPYVSGAAVASEGVQRVVIVGSGPAGLAAATYAARAGLRPVIVAPAFGGQLLGKGVDVENYPGVVGEQATGRGLVELMRRQAHSFDARFVDAAVLGVNFSSQPLRIRVNGTESDLQTQAVVLACGAESRWLQVPGEYDLRGHGVSACATCDGFLFRGREVAVIGGGDAAMEDALHLSRSSRQVTVVHRGSRFRASRILADRVLNHSAIRVRWNTTVEAFHARGGELNHLSLRASSGKQDRLEVSAAFVAIGHDPQTSFLKGQVELDDTGYVVLHGGTSTSVSGVFAAGDIADRTYRQAITASGTGAMAALDAERYLNELG